MAWVSDILPKAIYFRYDRWRNRIIFKCPVCRMIFTNKSTGKCPHCRTELDFHMYYSKEANI